MITFKSHTFGPRTFHALTFGGLGEALDGPFVLESFVFIIPGAVAWTIET